MNIDVSIEKRIPVSLSKTILIFKKPSDKKEKVKVFKYPPPFPLTLRHNNQPSWEDELPIPELTIQTSGNKVTLFWSMNLFLEAAEIKMYELLVCKETNKVSTSSMWKKTSITPDLLPMSFEVKIYNLGYTYYFALRAVDIYNRCTDFALQKTRI
ncbi:activating transcription factor 7-interacting protein 1-like [Melanaphis sacchari]|uniref:activating transcription factor 7-interacting protein 1-like n=1 Tax=Melanaphis sacchari TaxID=742174 RepID=UPI000DC12FFC|nr:activating transcription factor 7-interacting protein 1-like [Melanaphis sacchari]